MMPRNDPVKLIIERMRKTREQNYMLSFSMFRDESPYDAYSERALKELENKLKRLPAEEKEYLGKEHFLNFVESSAPNTVLTVLHAITKLNEAKRFASPSFIESMKSLNSLTRMDIHNIVRNEIGPDETKVEIIKRVMHPKAVSAMATTSNPIVNKGYLESLMSSKDPTYLIDKGGEILPKISRMSHKESVRDLLVAISQVRDHRFLTHRKVIKYITKHNNIRKLAKMYQSIQETLGNDKNAHNKATRYMISLLGDSNYHVQGLDVLHSILGKSMFSETAKTGKVHNLVNAAIDKTSEKIGYNLSEVFGRFNGKVSNKGWKWGEVIKLLKPENREILKEWIEKGFVKNEYPLSLGKHVVEIPMGSTRLTAKIEKDLKSLAADSWDCLAPRRYTPPGVGVNNFSKAIGWLTNEDTAFLTYYVKNKPIGRAYLIKAKVDGKPAIIVDSIEIGKDYAGEYDVSHLVKAIHKIAEKEGINQIFLHKRISNKYGYFLDKVTEPESHNVELEHTLKPPIESYVYTDIAKNKKGIKVKRGNVLLRRFKP